MYEKKHPLIPLKEQQDESTPPHPRKSMGPSNPPPRNCTKQNCSGAASKIRTQKPGPRERWEGGRTPTHHRPGRSRQPGPRPSGHTSPRSCRTLATSSLRAAIVTRASALQSWSRSWTPRHTTAALPMGPGRGRGGARSKLPRGVQP